MHNNSSIVSSWQQRLGMRGRPRPRHDSFLFQSQWSRMVFANTRRKESRTPLYIHNIRILNASGGGDSFHRYSNSDPVRRLMRRCGSVAMNELLDADPL